MNKNNELFKHPRWTEPPTPKVIGKVKTTKKEKKENKRKIEEAMKRIKGTD
ncbi:MULTISPECIES: hypothetical protein [Clostridia]|uniref:hypothetical protein n=1 Tax=Clostridia TaxID=186801 RepID=UPI0013144D5D|nr:MULTISPECIES: hypothetical protein [Clostridia]